MGQRFNPHCGCGQRLPHGIPHTPFGHKRFDDKTI
jgi:hypothetical protein